MKEVKVRVVCLTGFGSDASTRVQLLDAETLLPIKDEAGEELVLPVTHVRVDIPASGPATAQLYVLLSQVDLMVNMSLPDGVMSILKQPARLLNTYTTTGP